MSKSDPESAIFMEDTEADVNRKIKNAFCPPKQVHENPVFDYIQYIVFGFSDKFHVDRLEKWGGPKTYNSFQELVDDYMEDKMAADDIKKALSKELNRLIQPV